MHICRGCSVICDNADDLQAQFCQNCHLTESEVWLPVYISAEDFALGNKSEMLEGTTFDEVMMEISDALP